MIVELPEVPKEGLIALCGALADAIKGHPVLALVIVGILVFSLFALSMALGHRKDVKKIEEDGRRQRETFDFVHMVMNHKPNSGSNQQPRIQNQGRKQGKKGHRR
ncbi:hypothetical protein [Dyella sp.]|uniref:hypothetical protein n=1 Tax=Dyella sp. TaxID=1869338 RepID=UPI00283F8AD6|nr:hypothetical protein [Dyella sp.]MDR3444685.1 hypothetical protein [Dyella sp.]